MKFFAPTEEPIHIALTSGHTAVVTHEGTDLEMMFRREAIARGANAEGASAVLQDQTPQFDRKQVITDAINSMMDGDDEKDFTEDGKPNLKRLGARVGFQVARAEADAIFDEITKAQTDDAAE